MDTKPLEAPSVRNYIVEAGLVILLVAVTIIGQWATNHKKATEIAEKAKTKEMVIEATELNRLGTQAVMPPSEDRR
jgi:hypothetical protein